MKVYMKFDRKLASQYTSNDFSQFIENFPVPVCLFEMREGKFPHRFLYVNQKAIELMELTKDEILTYTWEDMFGIASDSDLEQLSEESKENPIYVEDTPLKRNLEGKSLKVEAQPVQLLTNEIYMVVTIIDVTDHQLTRQQLQRSEQEFGSMFKYNPDIAFSIRLDGSISNINVSGLETLKYNLEEVLDRNVKDLISLDNWDYLKSHFFGVISGKTAKFKTVIMDKYKNPINISVTAIPILVDNAITGVIGIARDITDKVKMETQIKESEQRYKALFDYNINPVMTFDIKGNFLRINEAATQLIGFSVEELIGKSFLELMDSSRKLEAYDNFQMVLDGKPRQYETMVIGRDKKQHLLHVMLIPAIINNELSAIHCVCKDITETRKNEDLANYMAYHDVLTSLGNQRLFQDEMVLLTQEECRGDEISAVMIVDLDRFKFINDHLGHEAGDKVLREVADRLVTIIDIDGSVFRYSGDEFTVILKNIGEDRVEQIAQKVLDEMRKPFILDGFETILTTSIGISVFPKVAQDMKGLMRSSDMAMYHAKRSGRNNYQFYNHHISGLTRNTLEIDSRLHKALEHNEFTLHYQPQYEAGTQRLCGTEALLRWENAHLGSISPDEFIPLAEENGLIVPIGEWVIHEACFTNKKWQQEFGIFVPVSVNLSLRQFYQKDLVKQVARILNESGLEPSYLMLEITESIAMQEDAAIKVLKELKALGVLIAMDDFGTGYSSLKHLRHFPIDHLKIDRAFVSDLGNEDGEAIVATIIALGHNLKIPVVAEGVETIEQANALIGLGCDIFQGYLYSRPLEAKVLELTQFN